MSSLIRATSGSTSPRARASYAARTASAGMTQSYAAQEKRGADAGTRTPDPFITSEVLYQLSYVGEAGLV